MVESWKIRKSQNGKYVWEARSMQTSAKPTKPNLCWKSACQNVGYCEVEAKAIGSLECYSTQQYIIFCVILIDVEFKSNKHIIQNS